MSADQAGQRLDNFLIGSLEGVPRSLVYRLVRTGQVRVNGRRAKPMKKLQTGDQVRIPPVDTRRSGQPSIPLGLIEDIRARILYQDDDLLVVDKPSGIALHGGSGLKFGLIDVLERIREGLKPVHRLDRPTSGVVVFAASRQASVALQEAFTTRAVDKRYLALLSGNLSQAQMPIDAPLKKIRDGSGQHRVIVAEDGQEARTVFRVLEALPGYSYVEAVIETGRTHQIRAHAAHIGHPIAGDERYNPQSGPDRLDRLFLHAHYLHLPWPEERVFDAPLPEALGSVLDHLRQMSPS
ncbi:RluA family pseudouridine synthase [Wenzhouxiangella sp. AB-CW3]|nr:RluA family pseudouridine synthase [Wenzhouxiangella sp. AB-CW3]